MSKEVMSKEVNIKSLYNNLTTDEKANVVTHAFGLLISLLAAPFLIVHRADKLMFVGLIVFMVSMCAMFLSSTLYHLANQEIRKNRYRIMDHISIFLLIGGTYTPFILIYYPTYEGLRFLTIHWFIILFGIVFKLIFKTKYELISLILYIVLGWMVLLIYNEITLNMPKIVNIFLLLGGSAYSIGVYFYVRSKLAWHHPIWHIFVILGCAGHYVALLLS
ncbi:MAG: hemolysin III family protein [Saprospiraceae bacterium]